MSHSNDKVAYDFSNLVVNEVEVETTVNTTETKKKDNAPFFEPLDYKNGAISEGMDYCWSQSFTEIGEYFINN